MTIGAEDMLWVAHWDGGRISRWNPRTGALLEEVKIPVSRVTSCVFGGEDLTDLYITTARHGLDEATLKSQPYAGGLFQLKTVSDPADRMVARNRRLRRPRSGRASSVVLHLGERSQ